jgi:hypothetical protein
MDWRASIGKIYLSIGATDRRYDPGRMDLAARAAELRAAAEAKPLKLPVNRRIDERHHLVTDDGLSVWFTIQVAPRRRILEAVFERDGARPTNEECEAWLRELMPGQRPVEAPGLPDAHTRRFEVFEREPEVPRV